MADGGHANRLLVGAELVDDAVPADAGRPKTRRRPRNSCPLCGARASRPGASSTTSIRSQPSSQQLRACASREDNLGHGSACPATLGELDPQIFEPDRPAAPSPARPVLIASTRGPIIRSAAKREARSPADETQAKGAAPPDRGRWLPKGRREACAHQLVRPRAYPSPRVPRPGACPRSLGLARVFRDDVRRRGHRVQRQDLLEDRALNPSIDARTACGRLGIMSSR